MVENYGRPRNRWVIILSLVFAAVLATVPMPAWLEQWRPDWVAIVLIYWVIALPHRVGLFTAWTLGFLMDVLEGSLLGLNALVLSVFAYAGLTIYQRMRMFTPLQQSIVVLMLIGLGQLIVFWVRTATGQNTADNLSFVLVALSSALIWPLMFVWLRLWRRSFQVN
jgi:rod shape-determining protein MreD